MHATATPQDYFWLEQPPYDGWIQNAYCVTTVTGLSAIAVITALDATSLETTADFIDLSARAQEQWDGPGAGQVLIAGFRDIPDGTLIVEDNGFLGTIPSLMRPLSLGRDVVSHFANVNALDRLTHWRDGETIVDIEPLTGHEYVPASDSFRAQAGDCGLDLGTTGEGEYEYDAHLRSRVWAIAERLSGIRLTPADLRDGLTLAEVRVPAAW